MKRNRRLLLATGHLGSESNQPPVHSHHPAAPPGWSQRPEAGASNSKTMPSHTTRPHPLGVTSCRTCPWAALTSSLANGGPLIMRPRSPFISDRPHWPCSHGRPPPGHLTPFPTQLHRLDLSAIDPHTQANAYDVDITYFPPLGSLMSSSMKWGK